MNTDKQDARDLDDPDGALPEDIKLLAALPLTPEQRSELVHYAATRLPPVSLQELLKQWLVEEGAMDEERKLN